MGIRLAIDDFGTGYSSLAYLKRLPVDEIKIDRSFVMHMSDDEDNATIVRSTIDLGENLGLQVVAEGRRDGGGLGHASTRSAARSRRATTSAVPCPRTSCARGCSDRTQAVAAISVLRGPPASTEEAEHAA